LKVGVAVLQLHNASPSTAASTNFNFQNMAGGNNRHAGNIEKQINNSKS
jgi:hypothetical protein